MNIIRLGLVGAGAAMQQLHLPAIGTSKVADVCWVVDTDSTLAKRVARNHRILHWGKDYHKMPEVDGVIIGTPHYLHVPMAEYFLEQGVHVLCEKPLALTSEDAKRLVGLAAKRGLVLAVGVFRRYYAISAFVRKAITAEWLGRLVRIDAEEGDVISWEPQSRFVIDKDKAGGGVLVDTGSHTIDRLLWWFDSPSPRLVTYQDNTLTGVESDCIVEILIPWRGQDTPVRFELSRSRKLRNTFQVVMENGMIEVPANAADRVWLYDQRLMDKGEMNEPLVIDFSGQPNRGALSPQEAFVWQIRDFCHAITTGITPLNNGKSCLSTIDLIETCYVRKEELGEPWVRFETDTKLLNRDSVR